MGIGLVGIGIIVRVIGRGALGIGMIVVELEDGMPGERFGIREGGADIHRMQRVVIKLPEILYGIQRIEIVQGIVVAVPVVDVDRAGDIQRERPEGLFEFMSQGQIGPVDVESAVGAVAVSHGSAYRPAILIDR